MGKKTRQLIGNWDIDDCSSGITKASTCVMQNDWICNYIILILANEWTK